MNKNSQNLIPLITILNFKKIAYYDRNKVPPLCGTLIIYKLIKEEITFFINIHDNYFNINIVKSIHFRIKYLDFIEERNLINFLKEEFKHELRKEKIKNLLQ